MIGNKDEFFFRFPGSFLQIGVQVAIPVLSALFGVPEDLVLAVVKEVKPLGDHLPVLGVLRLPLEALLGDQFAQETGFLLTPVVGGEVDFFEAEPLEHAGLAGDPGDDGGDGFPVLGVLNRGTVTISFSIS